MGVECVLGIEYICKSTQEELFAHVRGQFVSVLGVLLLVLIAGHLLRIRNFSALPESLVTVLFGALLGLILWASPFVGDEFTLDHNFVRLLMKWMLNLGALPIIIFESGWSLRLRDFISQLGYIMLFAIVGTIISVLVVAPLIFHTSHWHGIASWREAFAYASLISSVDPVSTLATFNQLNVDPLLFILVFGESQINDAVAITLFDAFNTSPLEQPMTLCGLMISNLCGSVGIGLALAILYILILRFTRMGDSPAQAILLVFMSCFFTFSASETLGLSGIISVLFNSIMMGAYTRPHLSTEGMALCSFLLKQMASLADSLIFLLCGILAVFVVREEGKGVIFGLALSLFCLVGRFMAIVPLGLLSNGIKTLVGQRLPKEKQHMISWKHMLMMWHSGLRGGIGIVLVMELGDWVDETNRRVMVNGTFILVVIYLLVFGGSAGVCLRSLGLPVGDQVPAGQTLYDCQDKSGYGWRSWKYMREHVMLPLLVGTPATPKGTGGEEAEVERGDVSRSSFSRSSSFPREGNCGLVDVLQEAEAVEQRPGFGVELHQHRSSVRGDLRSNILTLFGTEDPAHVEAAEDIAQDLRPKRAARGAAASSAGLAEPEPPAPSARIGSSKREGLTHGSGEVPAATEAGLP